MYNRNSSIKRETKETTIQIYLNIDSPGKIEVNTPVPFFNHMLNSLLYYMKSSASIIAVDHQNYDDHHIVEDTAITLGQALKEALGDKKGIKRFSSIFIPMDEALVLVALDISGRGMGITELDLKREQIGGLSMENVPHFFSSFAINSGITLHIKKFRGENEHHIVEAAFKGLGLCLYEATRIVSNEVPSTKGSL
ncbi:imidazoleglycerol-phosphate dehydratase [Acidianus manzaensis]|uniref:Imidazoleglycerol-phosphate dehydratase n=1 Tax=Acidianus manzaensis TaxID=282676 RepID=A0A1W6K3Q5_9CREN|nr:imidazoleglycerol-phosphate dehydratase [Acidianus manzaensis]ARM77146.1 imidazoleglycerol-phosphate dehydratase [Acidianus manzaensis]